MAVEVLDVVQGGFVGEVGRVVGVCCCGVMFVQMEEWK